MNVISFVVKDTETNEYYCLGNIWCDDKENAFSFSTESQAKTMIMMNLDGNYNRYKVINCSNVTIKITFGEFIDRLEELRDEYEEFSVDAVGTLSDPDEQFFTVRISDGNTEKRIEIPTRS